MDSSFFYFGGDQSSESSRSPSAWLSQLQHGGCPRRKSRPPTSSSLSIKAQAAPDWSSRRRGLCPALPAVFCPSGDHLSQRHKVLKLSESTQRGGRVCAQGQAAWSSALG